MQRLLATAALNMDDVATVSDRALMGFLAAVRSTGLKRHQPPFEEIDVPPVRLGMRPNDRDVDGRCDVPTWAHVRQRVRCAEHALDQRARQVVGEASAHAHERYALAGRRASRCRRDQASRIVLEGGQFRLSDAQPGPPRAKAQHSFSNSERDRDRFGGIEVGRQPEATVDSRTRGNEDRVVCTCLAVVHGQTLSLPKASTETCSLGDLGSRSAVAPVAGRHHS